LASPLQHPLTPRFGSRGLGVHSGQRVSVTISPAAVDAGIAFLRTDVTDRDPRIPALADRVVETRLGTVDRQWTPG